LPPELPDPNGLWEEFVTRPVRSLGTDELFRGSDSCNRWLHRLNDEAQRLGDHRALSWMKALGWMAVAVGLPAIFAAPPVGFAVWCFGAGITYGAHRVSGTIDRRLDAVRLLAAIFLMRQREVARELLRRHDRAR
jgi:hypothetical protein